MSISLSAADVLTCEACWRSAVAAVRRTEGGCPRRVDLFPPYGIYRLHNPAKQSVSPIRGDER